MSKEILLVVESVSNEKGVPQEVIFEASKITSCGTPFSLDTDSTTSRISLLMTEPQLTPRSSRHFALF